MKENDCLRPQSKFEIQFIKKQNISSFKGNDIYNCRNFKEEESKERTLIAEF
jgi:hypothetical protein